MYIVFDLDGTLSDPSHRLHLAHEGKWDEFYRECINDKPNKNMLEMMQTLRQGGHIIEVWTGRSDIVMNETKIWFTKYFGGWPLLRMRRHGDRTPDNILKERWLEFVGRIKPDIVFEDRQRVVDMYRKNGITVCQVAPCNELDKVGEIMEKQI